MYFNIIEDDFVEGNETFVVMLVLNINSSLVMISNSTIRVVIYDDDGKFITVADNLYLCM